jgi:hypothetical protein
MPTKVIKERVSENEATPPVSVSVLKGKNMETKEQPKVEPQVAFARWFRARMKERGFKAHWADGMKAYADITQRRTMSEWDEIFKNY